MPRRIEPTQLYELNPNKDSFEDLETFPYLEHVEIIADSTFQPPPPFLPQMETYLRASALVSDYIAKPWERNAQCCLETNIQNNLYNPFAMREEYKYLQCGIKKKGMKMYYDNVLKEENTTLLFPRFKNRDSVQMLVARMPDDQDPGEWELHSLKDMKWNHKH